MVTGDVWNTYQDTRVRKSNMAEAGFSLFKAFHSKFFLSGFIICM